MRCIHLMIAGLVAAIAPHETGARSAYGQTKLTAPATPQEIDALIHALGDPSFETRTFATRRLCAIGPGAAERLREAQSHACPEVALRASAVQRVLDQLWFGGANITLALSEPTTRWDQPVDLLITVSNPTGVPIKIPFDLSEVRGSSDRTDVRQVADMLDAAEWLRVRSPHGRQIDLRVDDVSADPKVAEVVQERASGGPVSVVEPGESATIRLLAINRGWARFPLLDRGDYALVLEYVPAWEDEVLAAAQAGRVVSNTVTLVVSDSAPEAVSRRGIETTVTIERQPGAFVARLTNRTDQVLHVNKNFGNAPPFAQGRWVLERENLLREFPLAAKPVTSWQDFDPALVQTVAPGDSIELASISVDELKQRLLQGAGNGADTDVYFGYSNLLTRQWQQRQPTPEGDGNVPSVLAEPLPRMMFGGWHTSNRLHAVDSD